MKFSFHLAGSIVVSAASTGILYSMNNDISKNTLILCASAVILGGIFPDTDTKSVPSKIYALMIALTFPLLFYADMIWYWVAFLVPFIAAQISKHRGWCHSLGFVFALIGIVVVSELISFAIPKELGQIKEIILKFDLQIICFALGVMTHLVLDHKIFKRFGR